MEGGLENNNDLNNTKSQGENYFNPSDEKNEPLATNDERRTTNDERVTTNN